MAPSAAEVESQGALYQSLVCVRVRVRVRDGGLISSKGSCQTAIRVTTLSYFVSLGYLCSLEMLLFIQKYLITRLQSSFFSIFTKVLMKFGNK